MRITSSSMTDMVACRYTSLASTALQENRKAESNTMITPAHAFEESFFVNPGIWVRMYYRALLQKK
jgi:hypothetical protein